MPVWIRIKVSVTSVCFVRQTLQVLVHGEGPDVTPVKVLNCDSITQVSFVSVSLVLSWAKDDVQLLTECRFLWSVCLFTL